MKPTAASTPKRDEIIARAYDVFYKQGFHATGVDTVLADSGISKRTLYKYFRTKEELIAAIVTHYQKVLFSTFPAEMAKRSSNPKQQILSMFDIEREAFEANNYNGCLAINAALEFQGKDGTIESGCSSIYVKLEEFIAELCTQAKYKNAKVLANQIIIILAGAIVLSQMHRDPNAMRNAKKMVSGLLK